MNEIIALVKQYLAKLSYKVEVVTEGVREDNGWWYVPVHAEPEPEKRWPYYEDLTDIETTIEDNSGIHVVLVPAS